MKNDTTITYNESTTTSSSSSNNSSTNTSSDTTSIFQQIHNYYKKNYRINKEDEHYYVDTNPNRPTDIIDFHKVMHNSANNTIPNNYNDNTKNTNWKDDRIIRIQIPEPDYRACNNIPMNDYYRGPWYGLNDFPGFMIAPSALSEQLQTLLCYKSVTEYCEYPHATNLSIQQQQNQQQEEPVVETNNSNVYSSTTIISTKECDNPTTDKSNDSTLSQTTLWEEYKIHNNNQSIISSNGQSSSTTTTTTTTNNNGKKRKKQSTIEGRKRCTIEKLAWSTLGYHYNWTVRSYHPTEQQSTIPYELNRLGQIFGIPSLLYEREQQQLQYKRKHGQPPKDVSEESTTSSSPIDNNTTFATTDYNPSKELSYNVTACIVNYYNIKSVMGGHQDNLEHDMTKPIVSISLGKLDGIFILGQSISKNNGPVVAIILRPGDVIILGGQCRLAYHSIPLLVQPPLSSSKTTKISQPTQQSSSSSSTINGANNANDNDGFTDNVKTTTTNCVNTSNSNNTTMNTTVCIRDVFKQSTEGDKIIMKQLLLFDEGNRTNECLSLLQTFLSQHRININLRQVY